MNISSLFNSIKLLFAQKPIGVVKQQFILSRSKYLSGLKCPALFWHELYGEVGQDLKKNEIPQYEKLRNLYLSLFSEKLFVEASGIKSASKETEHLLRENRPIVNASFLVEQLFTRIDLLLPSEGDSWEVVEFKFTSSAKKHYNQGMAFHALVLSHFGLRVSKYSIYTISSKYTFTENEIDLDEFIKKNDVTKQTLELLHKAKEKAKFLLVVAAMDKPPIIENYKQPCRSPKLCSLQDYCWKDLGNGDIFTLREGSELVVELYQKGIHSICEIPDDVELSFQQKIQLNAVKSKQEFFSTKKIASLLRKIRYPIYYLDFETINPPLPIYKGTKAFQHIPFQYSLHIQRQEKAKLEHYSYINDGTEEPRLAILQNLSQLIAPGGSILCYNDVFEKKCLRESVEYIEEYQNWFESILEDFVDMSLPFRNLHYYHPAQKGVASLKSVLPLLTNHSYDDLSIADGQIANQSFLKMKVKGLERAEKEELNNKLYEYCRMDTYALHLLLKELKQRSIA
ncbi:MAG: DUF2779 domain-containing protein [Spirochaetota bacterium]